MNTFDRTAETPSRLSRGLPDSPAAEMALAAARYPEPEMLDPEEEQRHYETYMERAGLEDRPCRCCSAAIMVPAGTDPVCQRCQESAERIAGPIGPWRREFLETVVSALSDETVAYIVADPARSLHAYAGLDVIREVYENELARRFARRETVGAA